MNANLIQQLGYVRVAAASPIVHVANPLANADSIIAEAKALVEKGAEVIVFPELCVTGYTCGDLFTTADLLSGARKGLATIRRWSAGVPVTMVVGVPLEHAGMVYNCAVVIADGHYLVCIPKTFLPNAGEYYDSRWFASDNARTSDSIRLGDVDVPFGSNLLIRCDQDSSFVLGVEICEDLWSAKPRSADLAIAGATLVVNCSASNELVGKSRYRRDLVAMQSARTYTAYAYASAGPTESTTDTVFGGHSMIAECGEVLTESERFLIGGSQVIADVDLRRCIRERGISTSWKQEYTQRDVRIVGARLGRSSKTHVLRRIDPHPFIPESSKHRSERCEEILEIQATALAMRLRASKTSTMVIGLSGGLDSTLAVIVAVRAAAKIGLPPSSIHTVTMPGPGTSTRTRANAGKLADALGTTFTEIPINDSVVAQLQQIGIGLDDRSVVYENVQARIRTQLLMNLANKEGGIVIGTGDLSEIALGWSTYNADHMSMYNPNAGVPKTLVRHLIRWYSASCGGHVEAILTDIIETPISPELLPADEDGQDHPQQTENIIGPYEVHDFFLYHLIRLREPVRTVATLACIAFEGTYHADQIVDWMGVFLRRFVQNQFKRSCVPDGPKVGSVALSPRADWRMPSDASPDLWVAELRSFAASLGIEVRF